MMAYMVYVSKYEKPTNIVDTSKNAPNTKKIGYFYMEKNLQHMILFYVSPLHRKKLQTKCGMMVPNSLKKKKHLTKQKIML
jgi:hypothetical protein